MAPAPIKSIAFALDELTATVRIKDKKREIEILFRLMRSMRIQGVQALVFFARPFQKNAHTSAGALSYKLCPRLKLRETYLASLDFYGLWKVRERDQSY